MDKSTSLFLDISRFSAAMIVFLGHTSGKLFTGGLFWQFSAYMQTAVVIFFVLSGYVIAYVVDTKENTIKLYSVSRISRLYSVAIPALLLTYICDSIGLSIDPDFYFDGPWEFPENHELLRYLASALFLNSVWEVGLNPGINEPYWSLSYEAFYYAFFAVFYYLTGLRRWILLVALMIFSGPSIVSLFPIWLLGYALYHGHGRLNLSWASSAFLFLLGAGLLIVTPIYREATYGITLPMLRSDIIAEYIDAIAFALLVAGFWRYAGIAGPFLTRFEQPIRWSASLTFALYLFHRPIIQVLGVIGPDDPASTARRLFILGGTAIIVITLGRWCERQKYPIKSWINSRLS